MAAVALVISVVAGIILALGRMSKPPISWLATLWVNVFRGIPRAGERALGLFRLVALHRHQPDTVRGRRGGAGTYLQHVNRQEYRSALGAIRRGQREAGLAVGLHRSRVFLHVVLPQATKIAIPNIGSMFIGMVKDASVFSVIGVLEVIRVTMNIESTTYQPSCFIPWRPVSMWPLPS